MKLVIDTQYRENYATHNWDGEGVAPTPYWKNKGGSTYIVENFKMPEILKLYDEVERIIKLAEIEISDEYQQEYVLSWNIEEDDFVSHDEKMQQEYNTPGYDCFRYDDRIDQETGHCTRSYLEADGTDTSNKYTSVRGELIK